MSRCSKHQLAPRSMLVQPWLVIVPAKRIALALLVCSTVAVLGGCRSTSSADHPELRQQLALTSTIGREIHRRDKLTWWSGELAHATLSPEQGQAVVGWIVDVYNPATDVLFFGTVDDEPRVLFVVRCTGGGPDGCSVDIPSAPMPLSERNLAQYRAVTTAWSHPAFERTSEFYNPVVIPTGEGPDADWWVYLVALNPDPNLIVLGRHYRFVIDGDGDTVRSFRSFSEDAVVLDIGAMELPERAQPIAISVEHLLDEVPTEMHVWAAINYGLELVVVTEPESGRRAPPTLWTVDFTGNIASLE